MLVQNLSNGITKIRQKTIKNRKKMETNYFRCYFSNDMYKVGNVITEKEFNRVPTIFKGNFKPYKENKQQFCLDN